MINKKIITLFVSLILIPYANTESPSLQMLLNQLKGPDDIVRMQARQLIPRYGLEAVPELISLLAEVNPVGKAARDTLLDTAAELCAPGRDKERALATDLLMDLIKPTQAKEIQVFGLEILALTVPEDYLVPSIGDLVVDPDLSLKAITALERINTQASRETLLWKAENAGSDTLCAILNALGELKVKEGIPLYVEKTHDLDTKIRLAAARALAFTSDPKYAEDMWYVLETSAPSPESRQYGEAMDTLIRFAEVMGTKPEYRNDACLIYERILFKNPGAYISAALEGLGRIGTGESVTAVLKTLDHEELRVRQSAENALKTMGGEKVTQQLISIFHTLKKETQLRLLPILTARKSTKVIPILKDAVNTKDKDFRQAALKALGQSAQPEALGLLLPHAKQNSEDASIAQASLLQLASQLQAQELKEPAGKAYSAVLEYSQDKQQQTQALEGIAVFPSTDACDAVMKAAKQMSNKEQLIPALAAVYSVIADAGNTEKSLAVLHQLHTLKPSFETLAQCAQQIKKTNPSLDTALLLGFVTRWEIIGPFPRIDEKGWNYRYVGEPNINLRAAYNVGFQKRVWKRIRSLEDNAKIDLLKELGDCTESFGYAYTEITVENGGKAVLKLGVDDGERIWVNDEQVFDRFVARPFKQDEDTVPVQLKAGVNKIILKIYQNTLGWEFCMRITNPDGTVFPFLPMKQSPLLLGEG